MSKAKLKKHLLSLPKELVVEIVLELYEARKEAKDYLEFYLSPNYIAELERCKRTILQEFSLRAVFPKNLHLPNIEKSFLIFRK